jgi:hypothetical protein
LDGTVEFGGGLRAKLVRDGRGEDAHRTGVNLRPFYDLLANETFVFREFEPTAPRPRRRLLARRFR